MKGSEIFSNTRTQRAPRQSWTHRMSPCRATGASFHVLGALAVLLAFGAGSALAHEGDEDEPHHDHSYQGAYWAPEVALGFRYRLHAADADSPSPLVAIGGRVATLMSLIDVRAEAAWSGYSTLRPTGQRLAVSRWSIGPAIRLHPLFVSHLKTSFFDRLKAGLYLEVGISLEYAAASVPDAMSQNGQRWGFGWQLGAGLDLPLTSVDETWSLWVGATYRLRFAGLDTRRDELRNFDAHEALVSLSLRFHDINFARVPKPGELHDGSAPNAAP